MWPTLLMLTSPEDWTPHATLAATKVFASNLDPKMSLKFYKEILLSKVREEIGGEGNRLSVQTYMALKKSIYKPAAFFKGILFPLCEVRQFFPQRDVETDWTKERHLHAEGGCHHRFRPNQGFCPRSPLRRRSPQASRDGLHRFVQSTPPVLKLT